jgi:hypothetical protein
MWDVKYNKLNVCLYVSVYSFLIFIATSVYNTGGKRLEGIFKSLSLQGYCVFRQLSCRTDVLKTGTFYVLFLNHI